MGTHPIFESDFDCLTDFRQMSSNKNNVNRIPQDELAMRAILKDMGITEYERRVVQQMLEFTYRYTTEILEEARVYSNHAKHSTTQSKSASKGIDIDDIKLAVGNYGDRASRAPPRTDLLHEMARLKNNQPLPPIKPFSGPRIPPDRYCLSGANFKAKENANTTTTTSGGGGGGESNSRNESFDDSKTENEMDF